MIRELTTVVATGFGALNSLVGLGAGLLEATLGSPELVVAMISLLTRIPIAGELVDPSLLEGILSAALIAMFAIYAIRLGRKAVNQSDS